MDKQDLRQELQAKLCRLILLEMQQETAAYKSPSKIRAYRLASRVEEWRAYADGHGHDIEIDAVQDVVRELLLLCEHLGITGKQPAAAGEELRDVEEQIADEVAMERRLGSTLLHILDEVPVDEGSHRQMCASIDKLMDRVQFWREHPGEAYEGQEVADVLMPIITQLLEHCPPAAGGAA